MMEKQSLKENYIVDEYTKPRGKKTRQGMSKSTKHGNKVSKKYYKKKYRGQGKWWEQKEDWKEKTWLIGLLC